MFFSKFIQNYRQKAKRAILYTQPLTLNVTSVVMYDTNDIDNTNKTDLPTEPLTSNAINEEETGCGSSLSSSAIIMALTTLGMGITFGKRKD